VSRAGGARPRSLAPAGYPGPRRWGGTRGGRGVWLPASRPSRAVAWRGRRVEWDRV